MTEGSLVIDACVVADALIDTGEVGARARTYLHHPRVYVPELLFTEVSAVLQAHERQTGVVNDQTFQSLMSYAWISVPFESFGALGWRLRHHVSMADACYLALAVGLAATLVTSDRKLARASARYCYVLIPGAEKEATDHPG